MKILIVTQKLDKQDPILGFFHSWVAMFAEHCEQVVVICLYKGMVQLPKNVIIETLGKEKRVSRITYIAKLFYYSLRHKHSYDHVFVHMNQIYILLMGCVWRMLKKTIGLWYVHRQRSISLRLASILAHRIFTVTPDTFPYRIKKVTTVGHGIDISLFAPQVISKAKGRILTVGRISQIKSLDVLIRQLKYWPDKTLRIVGVPITLEDVQYMSSLEELIRNEKVEHRVEFAGSRIGSSLVAEYNSAECFINLSNTGGIDKAVLESVACEVPTITTNKAFNQPDFKHIFYANDLKNGTILSSIINDPQILQQGRQVVCDKHSLQGLIPRIIQIYEKTI